MIFLLKLIFALIPFSLIFLAFSSSMTPPWHVLVISLLLLAAQIIAAISLTLDFDESIRDISEE